MHAVTVHSLSYSIHVGTARFPYPSFPFEPSFPGLFYVFVCPSSFHCLSVFIVFFFVVFFAFLFLMRLVPWPLFFSTSCLTSFVLFFYQLTRPNCLSSFVVVINFLFSALNLRCSVSLPVTRCLALTLLLMASLLSFACLPCTLHVLLIFFVFYSFHPSPCLAFQSTYSFLAVHRCLHVESCVLSYFSCRFLSYLVSAFLFGSCPRTRGLGVTALMAAKRLGRHKTFISQLCAKIFERLQTLFATVSVTMPRSR